MLQSRLETIVIQFLRQIRFLLR